MVQMATYTFGRFRLIPREEQLLLDGCPVALSHKALETLRILVANNGRVVEKREIVDSVWKGIAIDKCDLPVTIHMIRKALGDTRHNPRFIETVMKRGYRFIAATTVMKSHKQETWAG